MKKLALIALASLLSHVGSAQSGKNHQGGQKNQNLSVDEQAKKETQRVSQKLSLTKDQEVQWEEAAKERIRDSEPIRAKMKGSTTPEERQQLKKEMKANRDAFETRTESFLTPAQKTKYEDLKKAHGQNNHGGHKGHHSQKKSSAITD